MSSNIQVAIRVRPLISREKNEKLKEQWEINQNSMYPIDLTSGKRNGDIYNFDHIFDNTHCNADIYKTVVHPVVDKAMNGFNGTIFAYGQTSSGKTYTMMGDINEDGLITIAVQNIFLAIEQSVNRKFLLRVSYMEIYNEKIHDLLDLKNTVKISEDYSGSVIVNVKEEVTDCAEKIYGIMKKGDKARRIGETNMNEKSSRSHTIFRIIIESSDISDTGVVNVAHLNLVDLAGSERATFTKATGQRLKEGAHINKSLSTLSLVMKQLSESQDFINFRDSKLTRILQPSLGGNALTAIICAVTPAALEETISTLAFASRAKAVKNKPLLNEVVTDETLINRYALEINKLKRELEMAANDNKTLQAQKIAILEKCILFSKKTNNSNKNRRKTWSAPSDPSRTLPVIYEADVLRVSDTFKSDNLESEVFPFDDYPSSAPSSEKKSLPSSISTRSDTLSIVESKCESNGQPVKKSEDVVKWLINSTETPKSVLRERATYYEHEYNSLKELTTREKLILVADHNNEMEALQAELSHIKNELECERKIKKEIETKFKDEKIVLESKLDELTKKNNELTEIAKNVQKQYQHHNDSDFLVQMYKEKYMKREKELLDSLEEAREQLKSSTNNTDDEKNEIISTDFSITVDMKVFLEECKNQLNLLKAELESQQTISVVKKMFNEIKKLNEEMLFKSTDYSDDLQDLLNVFKYMFDLSSIILSDDTVILELEKEKRQLLHREKTYELLVSKQDEEIKHLSENILQYMNELAFHKSEVTKYKEMAKLETSLQTDLDFSIMTDTKNMTDYELNNESTLNLSELKLTSDQNVQTEEDFDALIQSKDKEIEEISDKIMEYVDQLSSLEQELNQLKSGSIVKQPIPTNIVGDHSGNQKEEIEDLKSKINDYLIQISKHEEQLSKYRASIVADNNLLKDKEDKITELTETIQDYEIMMNKYMSELQSEKDQIKEKDTEIEELSDNITNFISEITDLKNEINSVNVLLQNEKDLMNTKVEEIRNLSSQINTYVNQLSTAEEEIKNLKLASTTQDSVEAKEELQSLQSETKLVNNLIETKDEQINELTTQTVAITDQLSARKDNEIAELTEKVESYSKQLSDQENYKSVIKAKNQEIQEKDNNINYLTSQLTEYGIKLTSAEKELQTYKTNVEEEYNIQETIMKDKQELETRLSEVKEELQNYKLVLETEKDIIQLKDNQISDLNAQVIELSKELFALQNELEKYTNNTFVDKDLITAKDTEIQEVLSKLTAAEKELDNYKSVALVNSELIESKNQEIEEFKISIINYEEQVSTAKTIIKEYESGLETSKTDLKIQTEDVISKNREIEELSANILDYINQLSAVEEELNNYKSNSQNDKNLIESKDKEIEKLSSQIMEYIDQLSELEMEYNKYKSSVEVENCQIVSKNKEIEELTSKIADYENQLISTEEKIKKYKSDSEEKVELLDSINKEMKDLTEKVVISENQISDLMKLLEQKDLEINELNSKILDYNKQLGQYQEEIEIIKSSKLLEQKDLEIKELNSKILDYNKQLGQYEEEIENIKSSSKLLEQKDLEIKELNSKILDYNKQLGQYQEEIEIIKSSSKLLEQKDLEIKELNSKILDYNKQLGQYEEEIENIKSSSINSEKVTCEYLETKQDLEHANKTISELRDKLSQINATEELLIKSKLDLETAQKILQLKETEINELSENLNFYTDLVSSKEKEFEKYESQLKEDQNLIKVKDDEIKNISEQIAKYSDLVLNKDTIINNYMKDLEVEKDINKRTDKCIQDITDEHLKEIAEFEEEINNLKSMLNEKDDIIVHKENNIKSLNEIINQHTKQLQELNFSNDKLSQVCSEYEMLSIKYKAEEVKSCQYINKIRTLEQQLLSYDEIQNKNLQYCTLIENLQKQMRALQEQAVQHECTLNQYKDCINQLELEKNKILENHTLLRNTSLAANDKIQEQSKYIEHIQKELVTVMSQNTNTELTQEITDLKKKNEGYKKIFKDVTEKTNSKIISYNNKLVKLKQDNELLKVQFKSEKESNQAMHNQLAVLQGELEKRNSGMNSNSDLTKLQTKINNLEVTNNKLVKIIDDYQEQIHKKGNELSTMKNTVESLKYENLDLHKITRDLKDKLSETEVLLKAAQANVQLLERENENYNESSRNLEESLEDVKFELYELKNKEREKFKKAKRQSLHDSSRSLSSDEHLNINVSDENQHKHLPSFESSKSDETKSNECERCKQRMPLSDRQIDGQRDKVSKLQYENEKIKKKYEQVFNLCKVRKHKIDELERQVQSFKAK